MPTKLVPSVCLCSASAHHPADMSAVPEFKAAKCKSFITHPRLFHSRSLGPWHHGLNSRSQRELRTSDAEFPAYWHFNPKDFDRLAHPIANDDHDHIEVLPRSCSRSKLTALTSFLHGIHWPQKIIPPKPRRSWSSISINTREKSDIEFQRSRCVGKRAPKGYVSVYVGQEHNRVQIPIDYLNHPAFQELLKEAESEFGFRQQAGLVIPCSYLQFNEKLRLIESEKHNQQHCISLNMVHTRPGKDRNMECSRFSEKQLHGAEWFTHNN